MEDFSHIICPFSILNFISCPSISTVNSESVLFTDIGILPNKELISWELFPIMDKSSFSMFSGE